MIRIIDSIARDRMIDKSVLVRDVEQAFAPAACKFFNTLDVEEFTCKLDPLSGELKLFRHGEPLELIPQDFGPIAAQTFKQVMIQRFRDDERKRFFNEFSN